jgi:hypothetical protein
MLKRDDRCPITHNDKLRLRNILRCGCEWPGDNKDVGHGLLVKDGVTRYDYCEVCPKRKFNIIHQVVEKREINMNNNGIVIEEEESTFIFLPCEEAIKLGVNGLEETQKVFRLPDNGLPEYYEKLEIVEGNEFSIPRIKATKIKRIE